MSTTAVTLFELEGELVALIDTEEMVTDDQQRVEILQEIAQATEAAVVKRDRVIQFHRHLDMQQAAIDAEIKRLQALKANYAHAQGKLEQYVIRVMDECVPQPKRGSKRLEGSIGVLSLRKNPPAVEITDEAAVPTKFKAVEVTMDADDWLRWAPEPMVACARKTEYRVKKSEVKDALKAGEEVAGADFGFETLRLSVQ